MPGRETPPPSAASVAVVPSGVAPLVAGGESGPLVTEAMPAVPPSNKLPCPAAKPADAHQLAAAIAHRHSILSVEPPPKDRSLRLGKLYLL